MLQTRNGKRTGFAAVNIALDMVKERLISKEEAILRIPAEDLSHLLAPIFDSAAERKASKIGSGLPAGPGAASGHIYFTADAAVAAASSGRVPLRIKTSVVMLSRSRVAMRVDTLPTIGWTPASGSRSRSRGERSRPTSTW